MAYTVPAAPANI